MATERIPTRHHRAVPKGHCRWCREPIDKAVHPHARTWHPACVDEWRAQQPDVLRARVWKRDGGRCQECGVGIHDQHQRLLGHLYRRGLKTMTGVPSPRHGGTTMAIQRGRIGTGIYLARKPRWDMDHLVPLWAGGENTVANCRVLCRECHKSKTRREAAERAAARRATKAAMDPQLTVPVPGEAA